jgi:FHS family L-fucose permease-like MFS transporter
MQELSVNESEAASYYLAALVLFLSSRFVCTWLMSYIAPARLLAGLAALALGLCCVVSLSGGIVGCVALVAISACMSLMFPTIYGLGLRGLGGDTKLGGAGLVMAILGGAVLTGLQAAVSDATGSINFAYFVPTACFAVIVYYAAVIVPSTIASE